MVFDSRSRPAHLWLTLDTSVLLSLLYCQPTTPENKGKGRDFPRKPWPGPSLSTHTVSHTHTVTHGCRVIETKQSPTGILTVTSPALTHTQGKAQQRPSHSHTAHCHTAPHKQIQPRSHTQAIVLGQSSQGPPARANPRPAPHLLPPPRKTGQRADWQRGQDRGTGTETYSQTGQPNQEGGL